MSLRIGHAPPIDVAFYNRCFETERHARMPAIVGDPRELLGHLAEIFKPLFARPFRLFLSWHDNALVQPEREFRVAESRAQLSYRGIDGLTVAPSNKYDNPRDPRPGLSAALDPPARQLFSPIGPASLSEPTRKR